MAVIAGCSYDEFWNAEPELFWLYVNAYNIKHEAEIELWQQRADTAAWLQGYYVMQAVGACLTDSVQYPTKPESMLAPKSKQESVKEQQQSMETYFRKRSEEIDKMLNGTAPKVITGERRC
ncbi:hypothetical protein [Caproicibacterium amylolyticum]|uniref:Uncharacterized protein n=1 Tax=Caproicibacterium amylolyticum TaxID=2766537 RepID=A0A7G9WJZ6_9FIRM|nr:hypothetical protein [Caproicibacterium amylolyticum]MBE6721836.1 hypothetical protein [Oscillospiraceae bacterium]QNO19008.1 hypothetical protein H6X83_05145 [Caproicibacterium amylolyticum]